MNGIPPEGPPKEEGTQLADEAASVQLLPAAAPPAMAVGLRLLFAFLALAVVYSLMLVAGGEFRDFAVAGLQVIPFAILVVLAYAVQPDALWSKALTLGYWMVLVSGLGLMAVLFVFAARVLPSVGLQPDGGSPGVVGGRPEVSAQDLLLIGVSFLAVVVAVFLALCCFLPAVRRKAAKFVNIEADSFLHATALATVVATTLICLIPLLVSGEPPLLPLLRMEQSIDLGTADEQLRATVYSLIWAVPASLLAVGYPGKRTFAAARERLALQRPTRRQLVAATVLTGVLVLSMTQLESAITWFWQTQGWQITDSEAVAELFSFAIGPVGAIVVGITAGLGEELVFRGVLQPRLGIVLPALMFTAVHAFQYDFDALLQVLLLGIVFGIIRNRSNTTTTAIIHGGYDCVLLLWMYFTGGAEAQG